MPPAELGGKVARKEDDLTDASRTGPVTWAC
jgi:hypothetical protein